MTGHPRVTRAATVLGLALAGAGPAVAQTDYRNLEAGRPLRVEDAYALERHAFELGLPAWSSSRGGATAVILTPSLEYGILRNVQVGLAMPLLLEDDDASSAVTGTSGLDGAVLANLFTESPRLPALSLHVGGTAPFGAFAGPAHGEVAALLTRSFGSRRIHLNAAHRIGPDATEGEIAPRWWYGLALDETAYRNSGLMVFETRAERPANAEPIEAVLGVGTRWQWTPTLVLSLGVAVRLADGSSPGSELSLGITHTFAVPFLVPVRRQPLPPRPAEQPAGGHRHD